MVHRPLAIAAQWLGIALMIPGLLHVPLPQVDFHVIRHHHGEGESCPQHNHLLRWHPHAGETEAEAVLHWHWFLPHCLDTTLLGDHFGDHPVLHSHGADDFHCYWSPAPATPMDARGDGSGRSGPGAPLDLAWGNAPQIAPPPPWSVEGRPSSGAERGKTASLAKLVRWNC